MTPGMALVMGNRMCLVYGNRERTKTAAYGVQEQIQTMTKLKVTLAKRISFCIKVVIGRTMSKVVKRTFRLRITRSLTAMEVKTLVRVVCLEKFALVDSSSDLLRSKVVISIAWNSSLLLCLLA